MRPSPLARERVVIFSNAQAVAQCKRHFFWRRREVGPLRSARGTASYVRGQALSCSTAIIGVQRRADMMGGRMNRFELRVLRRKSRFKTTPELVPYLG